MTAWLERRGRRRVRAIMRGYRALKISDRLDLIGDVREAMTNTRFTFAGKYASSLIFGAGVGNAERIVLQDPLDSGCLDSHEQGTPVGIGTTGGTGRAPDA